MLLNFLNNADFNISGINIGEQEQLMNEKIRNEIINSSAIPTNKKKDLMLADKVKVKTLSFSHKTEDGKEMELPTEMESAGTNQFFGLGGVLFHILQNDKLLLIDEIDNSPPSRTRYTFYQYFSG